MTQTELILIKLGTMQDFETLDLSKVLSVSRASSVQAADLGELRVDVGMPEAGGSVLTLKGAMRVRAVFPRSFSDDNPAKAAQIASAVEARGGGCDAAAGRRPETDEGMRCPGCGADYRPGFTECPDCGLRLVERASPTS